MNEYIKTIRISTEQIAVGQGGRVVERRSPSRSLRQEDPVRIHVLSFQNLNYFAQPTLPVSFIRYNKSRWSRVPGVYCMRGT